jgi:hypothetical protein
VGIGENTPIGLRVSFVELIDLLPTERVTELTFGDAPEGIAALDDIAG